jgi:hypothetical protein
MTHTSPSVSFGIGYAMEIKQDSIPSMSNLQTFSKISDLRTDSATNRPYATYESDFWLLDGEYKFLPTNLNTVHVGLMTTTLSDTDGLFTVPPVLTITFTTVHSLDSLTIRFAQYSNDYANDIDVAYYDSTDTLIQTDNYTPTSWEFATGQAIANFKKIIITFNSTNKEFRFLRVKGIDYGELLTFTGAEIKAADVVEEINPLSTEITVDTFNMRLYSDNAQFSLINPAGDYANLAQRQPMAVYEQVGNQNIFIGQYYLDKWQNKSDTEIEFSCIDLVGVLGTMTYKGGIWTGSGIAVEDLLDLILGPLYAPFDLDSTLYGTMVTGWIPICTYREALQQIAFAIGAYIDTSRDMPIKIYPTRLVTTGSTYDVAITKAEKGMSQNLSLNPLVTGVEVTAHNIVLNNGVLELFNGTLAAGTHEITFSQPMHDLVISGATITASGANYATIGVTTGGTVVLSGLVYIDTKLIFGVYNTGISTSVKPNILKVEDASLVNSGNAATIVQRVYDYFTQRYTQQVRLYANQTQTGDIALIDTLYNKQIRGVVEKLDIDLAFGFVSQAEITGVEYVELS